MLLRKPGQSLNPRFVAWPLELGLRTCNPCFVAWPLELGLGTLNPRFVVWPLELGLGALNPRFVAWPLELGLGTRNPRFVVQEIRWADRSNPFNHCPHFPFFMMHFTDSMPISCIGGIWSADLWNPKYASHVYKVTVAVDMLGNIIWICPLAPGTSAIF